MSRFFRATGIFAACAMLLSSCGGGRPSAPNGFDNACSILGDQRQYARAFRAAERKWNVPVHVQMATIYQESRFKHDARTPFRYVLGVIPMGRQSSAYGYAQVLDATWEEYKRDAGSWGARRDDIRDAADFIGWYMNISRERNGISLNDARNQYLAYHEGHTGYKRQSYRSKAWLMRVAGEVQARAETYEVQLKRCRRFR